MKNSYTITANDRFNLSFGAILGLCFLQHLSGNIFYSIIIGMPMGIGGMAIGIFVMRLLGLELEPSYLRARLLNNPIGVVLTLITAFIMAVALLFLLPNEDRSISGIFLALTFFYFVSYIVHLTFSAREKSNGTGILDGTDRRERVDRSE